MTINQTTKREEELQWIQAYQASQAPWREVYAKLKAFVNQHRSEWRINKHYTKKILKELLKASPQDILGIPAEDLVLWQTQLLQAFDQQLWTLTKLLDLKQKAKSAQDKAFRYIQDNYKPELNRMLRDIKSKTPQDRTVFDDDDLKNKLIACLLEKLNSYKTDLPKQNRFMTYAQIPVVKEMVTQIYDEMNSELSQAEREWIRRISKQKDLSDEEIALGYWIQTQNPISVEKVSEYRELTETRKKMFSFDQTYQNNETSLHEILSVPDTASNLDDADHNDWLAILSHAQTILNEAEYLQLRQSVDQGDDSDSDESLQIIFNKLMANPMIQEWKEELDVYSDW